VDAFARYDQRKESLGNYLEEKLLLGFSIISAAGFSSAGVAIVHPFITPH
jgi:hypothetical protein